MTILVVYSSKHGATEGIARALAERFMKHGQESVVAPVTDANAIDDAQTVVLGSAVYAGSWMREAIEWAHANAKVLQSRSVWLFSSGPLGEDVDDEQEQPRQLSELTELLRARGHRMFFGALDKSKLGFPERMMVKAVKAPEGDFRDWDDIRGWADEIAEAIG
jgi:menaquinone-dependent protoporphyrinogen oxidase